MLEKLCDVLYLLCYWVKKCGWTMEDLGIKMFIALPYFLIKIKIKLKRNY
jgi:hypothetical protein